MTRFAALLLTVVAGAAGAQDFRSLQNLGQHEFRLLSEDLGSALSYHPMAPAEAQGFTGFDVGAAVTFAKIRNVDVIKRASSDSVPSYLPIPTLRANKGLPLGFDIGGMFSAVPGTDIKLWGLEAKYAILKGGVASPALNVRGSYTKLTGVDQLDLNTKGLDASFSKGFLMLTPYIGAGRVWTNSQPHVGGLSREEFAMNKVFLGAGFKMFLFNMNAELDRTGGTNAYSLKAGLRF